MPRNFLTTADWTREELEGLLAAAARFKSGEDASKPLAGRSVGLVFFNPSLRTRASMQVGVYELGGNAVVLEPGGTSWTLEHREGAVMDGDKTEHVAEFVRVLGRYAAASAKLFGTAIGRGFGCQAQVKSTRFFPSPSFSRTVSMSAID